MREEQTVCIAVSFALFQIGIVCKYSVNCHIWHFINRTALLIRNWLRNALHFSVQSASGTSLWFREFNL